jgi:hypothetical protein
MNDKKQKMAAVPTRRLHPTDGLAVTAKVWATAHDYHRLRLQAHQALAHAPGVLLGLGIIASDPPDSTVYILSGLALAPGGELIVVEEPLAYDLGTADGPLTLWLSYAEGAPHSESDPEAGEVAYVPAQFSVEAQPNHVAVEGVELARVRRTAGDAPLTDATDVEFPAPNEIDLRFRREMVASAHQAARMAVGRLGDSGEASTRAHEAGTQALGRALRHTGRTPLWVDVDVPLEVPLGGYTVLYLVADAADVETEALNRLYDYLQDGGTVFIEVGMEDEDGTVEAAVFDMLGSLGITLEPVRSGHTLLTTPHLFATAPSVQEIDSETPALMEGGGVVFSRAELGRAWGGHGNAPLTRAEIRTAHEWGENLVHYAQARKK